MKSKKIIQSTNILTVPLAIALLGIFYFAAYGTIVETNAGDYFPHMNQALHWRNFFKLDFQSLSKTAPLPAAVFYPGWHISLLLIHEVLKLFGFVADKNLIPAAALLNAIVNTATMLVISFVFTKFLKTKNKHVFVPLFSVVMLFCGPIFIPCVNKRYYLGQLFSGVWNNPTTQPLKLFIVIIFFLYCHMIKNKDQLQAKYTPHLPFKISRLNFYFILTSLLLLLSAIFKTSLILVYIPALFVFCCIDVIASKFKSFHFCFKTGLSVIPACVMLCFQSFVLGNIANQRVVVSPMTVWESFSPHPFLSILISIPFPIFAICVCRRQLFKDKMMLLSIITLVISIIEFMFLAVVPDMLLYGDFSWGMQLSTLLIFITSFIAFHNHLHDNGTTTLFEKSMAIFGYTLLFTQFLYGFVFFGMTAKGATFFGGWL